MTREWVQSTALADILLRTADARPDHEALVFPTERFSYREVAERSIRAARNLAGIGIRRGDHVGLLMPNCPDFVFTFFGLQLLAAVAVPINTRFRTRELAYIAENADLDAIVTSDIVHEHVDFVERLHAALPGLAETVEPLRATLGAAPRLRSVVLLGGREADGMVTATAFAAAGEGIDEEHVWREREHVRVRDPAVMLFTSGTTAQPKGCMISHEAIARPWLSSARRFEITRDDRVWDALPLFHMSCLGPLLFCCDLGATMFSMTHFEAGAALDQIERERPTRIYSIFPPIIMAIVKHESFARRDLSFVRGLMNVAPVETMNVIQAAFPQARNCGGHFGMTEASGAITCNYWNAPPEVLASWHGPPLPGVEVRAVDPETREPLPPNVEGELQVRGCGLFEGYYRDPELTAEAMRGGWLNSGDLGIVDEAGNVKYLARLKDMLKVGGENVGPAEIESHLSTHPAVKLVQVVGAPDERLVEVPAAFIELVPGVTWTEEEAIEYCQGEIASFKVPRYVRFVEEWPMSATKIQKFRLREQIAEELAAAKART